MNCRKSQLVRRSELPIEINRVIPPPELFPFTDYFKGFEKVRAVRSVFGEETDAVLGNLKVGFISLKFMYMGIRDEDGNISVGTYHLGHSDLRILYLDVVHELFHVKQWQEDKSHFGQEHQKFMGDFTKYYSSPIEVPAYRHTVREAERLGMSQEEIAEYLKIGPVPSKIFAKFLRAMELGRMPKSMSQAKLPVRINRKAPISLFPFKDYLQGFEKVVAVRNLFREKTDAILDQLKVEFIHSTFVRIIPSEDGHLLVGVPYLESSDPTSVYLDVLLSLNMVQRASREQTPDTLQESGDSPALIESYKAMVEEARRIGQSNPQILEHLRGQRFLMRPAEYKKFLKKIGLGKSNKKSSKR
jgi:hypothetical protein